MSLEFVSDLQPFCTLHAQQEIELEWTPETTHVAGTEIQLRADQFRCWYFWKYIDSAMDGGDITWRWRAYPQLSDHHENPTKNIFAARLPRGAREGEPYRIRLTVIPPYIDSVHLKLSVWVTPVRGRVEAPPEPQPEIGSTCVVPVRGGVAERLAVWARPAPLTDGKVHVLVAPHDRFGNPTAFASPIDCELNWQGQTWTEAVQAPLVLELAPAATAARLRVRVPMAQLAADENLMNAARDGEFLVVHGNPVWPDNTDGLRPAFGEMHWHTDFSGDGQGPFDLALRNARDAMHLDFAAPGDHSPSPELWRQTVEALEAFHEPGRFATFFGWERSTRRGHENFYFTDPDHPLRCHGKYAEAMAERGSVRDPQRPEYINEPGYLCMCPPEKPLGVGLMVGRDHGGRG